jgi:hypothetical protein
MNHRLRAVAGHFAAAWVFAGWAASAHAQSPASDPGAGSEKAGAAAQATGTFDVKLNTLPAYDTTEGSMLGRMSIDKQYHGDLEGTGTGEMLTAMTSDKDSGAYVAVERVIGTLQGRRGTFEFVHRGIMTDGAQDLSITVVPDSGTDQLKGIAGSIAIEIADGKHSYRFDYTLRD